MLQTRQNAFLSGLKSGLCATNLVFSPHSITVSAKARSFKNRTNADGFRVDRNKIREDFENAVAEVMGS